MLEASPAAVTAFGIMAFAVIAVVKITANYKKLTIPGLIVLLLMWWARWWMNLAIQSDNFLVQWRHYVKTNPIQLESMKPVAESEQ